jgi:hypothetical protein
MIGRSIVQKKCQEGVNTRENGSSRCAVHVYYDPLAHPHSIVLGRSFLSCSLLLREISQTCSQLIHTRFVAALASGLRLEIGCESDKKKMNFIFNYDKKIFLTEKMKHACRRETKKQCVKTISPADRDGFGVAATTDSLLINSASRVDRIGLCAQFLASASGA